MIMVALLFFASAPVPTAREIMAKVAENQDRAESMRLAFVYHQSVLLRMNHTNGKLAREETSEYTVAPTPTGFEKKRTQFLGKYFDHGRLVEYHEPGVNQHVHIDIDGEVVTDLTNDLSNDRKGKDGIVRDLFPLTVKEQKKYEFTLDGSEDYRGTPVYRITFKPAKSGDDDTCWAGEALIHRGEYQPVLVTTHLECKIPVLVKTILGTNLQHTGFKVTYQKFDEGVWFPVTYGGELKLRALFFYARRIGVSVQNSEFQRAAVDSNVKFAKVE